LSNLAEVAPIDDLDKSDPCRTRYGEIIGKSWDEIETPFLNYVARDAVATAQAYPALRHAAEEIVAAHQELIFADAADRFGSLTESIQIKAAVALADIERRGIHLDASLLSVLKSDLQLQILTVVDALRSLPEAEGLFKLDSKGNVKVTPKGWPQMTQKTLQACLAQVLQVCRDQGLPGVPATKQGLSAREADWTPYAVHSAFIRHWLRLRQLTKSLAFCDIKSPDGRVHSRYDLLKVTGRTGCSRPNIQQLPRSGGFRECFTAAPGHYFVIIDYSFIELVTLAAICRQRFGESKLADVITEGVAPHAFTAARINNIPLTEFMALKETDPVRYKEVRQKAKALNFGIPGGLSAAALREYAAATYGVELSPQEAERWRQQLIAEVYPEIGKYLEDRLVHCICRELGCTERAFWSVLSFDGQLQVWLPASILNILGGGQYKRDGAPYNPRFLDRVWGGLYQLCRDPELKPLLMQRKAGPDLAARFAEAAVTPTGRVRANVSYTEARNNPFQGLAADGAKLALFELVRRGYRVVAFIHDEFVIELPVESDHTVEAQRIERIVCDAMRRVLGCDLPVKAEYALATCWSKAAAATRDENGRLLPWAPEG